MLERNSHYRAYVASYHRESMTQSNMLLKWTVESAAGNETESFSGAAAAGVKRQETPPKKNKKI